jgi:hypothetical protein
MAARKPRLKATHQVPSGLGGAFDVAILSEDGDYSFVRVVMPGAADPAPRAPGRRLMPKSADTILLAAQARAGWTDSTALAVVLEYVQLQDSNAAFRDFLEQQIEDEYALDNIAGGPIDEDEEDA